jgi:uncharacterized protein DUF3221
LSRAPEGGAKEQGEKEEAMKEAAKRLMVLLGMLALMLGALAVPAMAQQYQYGPAGEFISDGSGVSVQGTITSISGSAVLVEEVPSAQSGDKGSFTVTDETEITRQEDGASVPAAFGDLEVGQIVEATYAGDVAESYPTQGNAASIAILGDPAPSPGSSATFTYELAVECEPPADAEFLGLTATESLVTTPLTDPDGDGVYTGSQAVPRFAPGGPSEPITISPVRIVQGPPTGTGPLGPEYRVIEDFGAVVAEDRTLSASVSFCAGGSGGVTGGGGDVVSGDTNDADGGAASGGTTQLPATGGVLPVAGAVGTVLLAGGLIARRITR